METKKYLTVDFADIKDVLVTSFSYHNPFSGCLEGSYHSNSMSVLEDVIEEAQKEGHYFKLTPDQIYKVRHPFKSDIERACETDLLKPDEALEWYLYKVAVEYRNHETFDTYLLTIYWFDDVPSGDKSLRDIINPRTLAISLFDNAFKYNIDDDF